MNWRYWLDSASPGARNMAVDHALAESAARSGDSVVRFYRWDPPTISFGRNEPAAGLYDTGGAEAQGIAFVRRPTGGRAVLHADELTYSVATPLESVRGLKALYRTVNEGLVRGLVSLGADVVLHRSSERPPGPSDGPCFQEPVTDEVVWQGRKLVGSAQVRLGRAVLQHGSVIVGGRQDAVSALKGEAPGLPPAALEEVLGERPAWEDLAEALQTGLEAVMGGTWNSAALYESEILAAKEHERHYSSDAWTWRK